LVRGQKDEKFWQQDCSAATENILLAAEAMGLGAVWCAGYPLTDRTDSYKALFNYSDEYEVLSLISIGYPTGEDEPKDKYKEEKIHWNRW
ncbi:nitroreductase family protein, partial [bacterium]|nr:nitroreductase family protein [bacterium]